ncbi:MAG: hypothetical protein HY776_02545, partial [Actinobacteria bacterium]|nr:hypothetical protein [Actinomycetota bacterium]
MFSLRIKRAPLVIILVLVLIASSVSVGWASIPVKDVDYPEASEQPLVDGLFTTSGEYSAASSVTDPLGVGMFYFEHTHNWAPPGKSVNYPGTTTIFQDHDIWAYDGLDDFDLNTFVVYRKETKIVTFVFLPGDEPDDTWWLTEAGLNNSPLLDANGNINDDGGFLIRVNDDPRTDRLWRLGYPEPGDPGWNFADYYGVFAKGAFTNSAYTTGRRLSPSAPNENYEFSITFDNDKGIFWPPWDPGWGIGPPWDPNPFPILPDCWSWNSIWIWI